MRLGRCQREIILDFSFLGAPLSCVFSQQTGFALEKATGANQKVFSFKYSVRVNMLTLFEVFSHEVKIQSVQSCHNCLPRLTDQSQNFLIEAGTEAQWVPPRSATKSAPTQFYCVSEVKLQ